MRKQGQISPWSLPHTISSICCGSGTAHNATSLRYQGGKTQVNERRTPCEQAVIPFRSRQFAQNHCSAVTRKERSRQRKKRLSGARSPTSGIAHGGEGL